MSVLLIISFQAFSTCQIYHVFAKMCFVFACVCVCLFLYNCVYKVYTPLSGVNILYTPLYSHIGEGGIHTIHHSHNVSAPPSPNLSLGVAWFPLSAYNHVGVFDVLLVARLGRHPTPRSFLQQPISLHYPSYYLYVCVCVCVRE